jgi:effector-binding domain-containing protein
MLEVRRADAERALSEEAMRLKHIEARIAQIEGGGDGELDDVLIRTEPARRIIAVRGTLGSFQEARQLLGELARCLPATLSRESLGSVIGILHSTEFEPDAIDLELGFVLNGEAPPGLPSAVGQRRLCVRELPPVTLMAACVRIGLPEHAHLITGKIGRYVENHGYRLAGPSREVFLRPPRLDRLEESVVEMQFPVDRSR